MESTTTTQQVRDDVQGALQTLTEGLPDRNAPYTTGTGELDNAEVRHLLAGAAFVAVLRSDPSRAFDDLAHYLDESEILGWFGNRRAELILEMLLYQTGWTEHSSWNSVRERELGQLGTRPDRRWVGVCLRLGSAFIDEQTPVGASTGCAGIPRLKHLAKALQERIAVT